MNRVSLPGAVVFDLDGTLIDSIPDVVAALNRLLVEEGRAPVTVDQGRLMVGEGAAPLIERGFVETGDPVPDGAMAEFLERYLAFYKAAPTGATIVYPAVADVLSALSEAGVPMGICTNKPHEMSLLVLEKLGFSGYFSAIIGGDAARRKKPDGGHVHEVLGEMGVTAEKAIFVGDSRTDVLAARNAGLPVVAVSYGYSRIPPAELGADLLIDHFAELPEAMAHIMRAGQAQEG